MPTLSNVQDQGSRLDPWLLHKLGGKGGPSSAMKW